MKILALSLLLISGTVFSQVGINTTEPKAALDVTSTNQGILIPRVALVQTSQELPVTNPDTGTLIDGTLVYNTATINDVRPGFYFWKDVRWIPLISNPQILSFTSITLPSASGQNNNVDFLLNGANYNSNVFRIVHSGAELGGIVAGEHGRIVYIYNGTSTDLKILSENNSTSTPANRFSADGDLILKPGNTVIVIYDGLYLNRWSVVRSDN